MCCLGAPIALLWRFRELPEDLASYGPLPGLLCAATSLLFSCSVVALLLCVVAFSSLLPFSCNHLALCPFLWSLPPLFFIVPLKKKKIPAIPFTFPPIWNFAKLTKDSGQPFITPSSEVQGTTKMLTESLGPKPCRSADCCHKGWPLPSHIPPGIGAERHGATTTSRRLPHDDPTGG